MDTVGAEPGHGTPALVLTDGGSHPVPNPDESNEPAARIPAPMWRRLLRVTLIVAFLAVAYLVLRDKIPSPASIWASLRKARWGWVVGAMALQIASIGMQIRQQRRLLRAFGVVVSRSRIGAITYSSTAISMSMPAGGAVSAGYTYRQYRSSGASGSTAATVLLLSGLASFTALLALSLAGFGVASLNDLLNLRHQHPWELIFVALLVAAIVEVLVLLLRWFGRRRPRTARSDRLAAFEVKHSRLGPILRQITLSGTQASHLPGHDWRLVLFTSAGNWSLDAACLYASCEAFSIHIGVLKLGAVYLGVQLVRQIPITPGGIGVIEASLLAGLVAAHAAKGPAAAAVLTYRLFAAWLIVPIGFVMLAILRRRKPKSQVADVDLATIEQHAPPPVS